jgi:hypothetical protein
LLGAGTDACELIHYGMELVNVGRSVFDVISTLFTAVPPPSNVSVKTAEISAIRVS